MCTKVNQSSVAVARREIRQPLELRFLDQSGAMHGTVGVRAQRGHVDGTGRQGMRGAGDERGDGDAARLMVAHRGYEMSPEFGELGLPA